MFGVFAVSFGKNMDNTFDFRASHASTAIFVSTCFSPESGFSRFQCYAPKGVHVCHVVLDGVIASPNTKGWASKVGSKIVGPLRVENDRLGSFRKVSWVEGLYQCGNGVFVPGVCLFFNISLHSNVRYTSR